MKERNGNKQPGSIRVLIVEDEPSAREASGRYLRHCGHNVDTAADASEALKLASAHPPDVAVCDWWLAGKRDGVEVARELQKKYGVSIIFVTAHPLEQLRNAARDLSVSRFMRKPLSLPKLAEALRTVIV